MNIEIPWIIAGVVAGLAFIIDNQTRPVIQSFLDAGRILPQWFRVLDFFINDVKDVMVRFFVVLTFMVAIQWIGYHL